MGEKQWEKWEAGAPPCEPKTLAIFRAVVLRTLEDDVYAGLCSAGLHADSRSSGNRIDGGKGGELTCSEGARAHDHPEGADSKH
jgi:hypothetical protein